MQSIYDTSSMLSKALGMAHSVPQETSYQAILALQETSYQILHVPQESRHQAYHALQETSSMATLCLKTRHQAHHALQETNNQAHPVPHETSYQAHYVLQETSHQAHPAPCTTVPRAFGGIKSAGGILADGQLLKKVSSSRKSGVTFN